MGEYADLTWDRDFNRYMDGGEEEEYTSFISSPNKNVIKYKEFPEGELVLARKYEKYYGNKLVFNRVCKIIKNTDKAVLFKIDPESEPDCKNAGKEFWVPKSVIYMLKNELKVVYFKQWVTLKILDKEMNK